MATLQDCCLLVQVVHYCALGVTQRALCYQLVSHVHMSDYFEVFGIRPGHTVKVQIFALRDNFY